MHYSDSYKLIKNVKNKAVATRLKKILKELEEQVNNPCFISFLKKNTTSTKSIFELQKEYDKDQLQKVITGIKSILPLISREEKDLSLLEIRKLLRTIKKTASNQQKKVDSYKGYYDYYSLAKKYATHYIPFVQSNDPFKGSDYKGYCWGHSYRYGQLVSKSLLDTLSVTSDKKLYATSEENWTFTDILFRQVGWYFQVSQEMKIRKALWDTILQVNEYTILNFCFSITSAGLHSTTLRMVGDGIEYYDNNYGIVRFNCREQAVNFLAGHLLNQALKKQGEIEYIKVFKLPFTNVVQHDVFADLPQTRMNDLPSKPLLHDDNLAKSITDLEQYAAVVKKQKGIKAKIKANEITCLVKELLALPTDKIHERIKAILAYKKHSLMINRGTGLYFFKSRFESHSTSETLLNAIYETSCSSTGPRM